MMEATIRTMIGMTTKGSVMIEGIGRRDDGGDEGGDSYNDDIYDNKGRRDDGGDRAPR